MRSAPAHARLLDLDCSMTEVDPSAVGGDRSPFLLVESLDSSEKLAGGLAGTVADRWLEVAATGMTASGQKSSKAAILW